MKATILILSVLASTVFFATALQAGYIMPTGVAENGTGITDPGVPGSLIKDAVDASYVQSNPGGDGLGDLWEAVVATTTYPANDEVKLTFDLGAKYNVSALDVWRYNRTGLGQRSVNLYSVLGSSDGSTFNLIGSDVSSLGVTEAATETVQTRTMAGLSGANVANAQGIRYVQLDITASFEGMLGQWGANHIGLGEVGFEGTVVPEPGALILLGTALMGLLAYAWRKRR